MAGYVTKKTYDFYPRPPRGGRLRHSSKLQQDKGYFYPRPPRGGRLCIPCACWLCPRFLSTPSARRATAHKCPHCAGLHISIHALREEGDLPWLSLCSAIGKFLSTPSARRATDAPLIWATSLMYFYPRPLRGGRLLDVWITCDTLMDFYPRPLRGGRPSTSVGCVTFWFLFLSTPSARRATRATRRRSASPRYFYPRPLRGGRRHEGRQLLAAVTISIHALCEEGDGARFSISTSSVNFYPRPLRGGRRVKHARTRNLEYFYPRPLRGGRLGSPVLGNLSFARFLSTPSARRATEPGTGNPHSKVISIHALCEEGDPAQ